MISHLRTCAFLCGQTVSGCNDERKVLTGREFDAKLTEVIGTRENDE